MRRFLATTLLFLMIASFAPAAYAAPGDAPAAPAAGGTGSGSGTTPAAPTGSPSGAPAAAPSTQNPATGADVAQSGVAPAKAQRETYSFIMTSFMNLFAWLLGVAAITLDNAVYFTVVKMGDYISNLSAVGVAWRILRDIANILLIFGFLGIGIATMIDVKWYGGGTSLLPKLIVSAILINFSLFISGAVIDAGNLFATQFYTQINGGQTAQATTGDFLTAVHNEGISNMIMGQLGLQSLYGNAVNNKLVFRGDNPWYIGFLGIILFMVAAFVMFTLAFILIARFVILLLVMIVAPIGFVSAAVPKLEQVSNLWKKTLIDQTITAPILLLILYVALAVINDANFLSFCAANANPQSGGAVACTPNWTGFVNNGDLNGFGSILLSFLVAMGLLLMVIVASKKFSAFGGAWATRLGAKASFGATAWGGRLAFGGIGRGLNSQWMRSRAAEKSGWGHAAKAGAFLGRRLENRTYDIRNVGVLGTALGVTGVPTGSKTTAKQAVAKVEETAKYVKPFTGGWWRETQKGYEDSKKKEDRKKNLANPGSSEFNKEIKKMSEDELTELKGIRQGLAGFVNALSPEKYAAVMKSPKLQEGEKAAIKETWGKRFSKENVEKTIGSLTEEEVAALDPETLMKKDVIETLGPTELDAIMRKGKLSKEQRGEIRRHMRNLMTANKEYENTIGDYFSEQRDPRKTRSRYWRWEDNQ